MTSPDSQTELRKMLAGAQLPALPQSAIRLLELPLNKAESADQAFAALGRFFAKELKATEEQQGPREEEAAEVAS